MWKNAACDQNEEKDISVNNVNEGRSDQILAVHNKRNIIIMKIRFNEFALDTLSYLFMVQYIYWVNGSEFPERECCDTIFSSPPNPEPVQPTRSSIIPSQFIPSTDDNSTTGELNVSFCVALDSIIPYHFGHLFQSNSCNGFFQMKSNVVNYFYRVLIDSRRG